MSSPTGRTVSRVSVRVLPNTATFGRSLKRYLERVERTLRVQIPTVLDTSTLDADLRALRERLARARPVKIPVEYDQTTAPRRVVVPAVKVPVDAVTAGFEQQVRSEVAKIVKRVSAEIPLTTRGEGLRQQVAAQIAIIERTLSARIPIDPSDAAEYRRRLAAMVKVASAGVTAEIRVDVDRGLINRLRNGLGAVLGLGQQASATFGTLTGGAAEMGTTLAKSVATGVSGFAAMAAKAATLLVGIVAVQIAIPALATGLVGIAGLGVSAFGAIAAGAGGLPVLLTGLLAPIAAVMLGMDGITRAAGVLTDEVDQLRRVTSVAFEVGLLPVFRRLEAVFPVLNVGIPEVARGLSRMANSLTDVVVSQRGLDNIKSALIGVSTMLDRSRDGAVALLNAVLNIAGTRELYAILGDTIGGVAERLGNMLERMRSSGDLERGLIQLRDLLHGLVDLVVVLTEGSVRFFANAGPGLTSFLGSLTETLSRVNWAELGEAFGSMMERLGRAIADVPPETWQELGDAIGRLVQQFLTLTESGGIAGFITSITGLITFLVTLGDVINGVEDGLNGLNDFLSGLGDSIYNNITKPFYDATADLLEFLGIASPAQVFLDIGLAIVAGLLLGLAGGPAAVFGKIAELGQRALDALAGAPSLLTGRGREFVEGAIRGIAERLGDARATSLEIKNTVTGALADARDWLVGLGADMVGGFLRGIGSKIAEVAQAAAGMAKRAYDAARAALDSNSPSRLFAGLGRSTAEGYVVGIEDRFSLVNATIRSLVAEAARAAHSEGGAGTGGRPSTSASLPGLSKADITEALLAALNAARWVARGEDLTLVVNRGNALLGRT